MGRHRDNGLLSIDDEHMTRLGHSEDENSQAPLARFPSAHIPMSMSMSMSMSMWPNALLCGRRRSAGRVCLWSQKARQ